MCFLDGKQEKEYNTLNNSKGCGRKMLGNKSGKFLLRERGAANGT